MRGGLLFVLSIFFSHCKPPSQSASVSGGGRQTDRLSFEYAYLGPEKANSRFSGKFVVPMEPQGANRDGVIEYKNSSHPATLDFQQVLATDSVEETKRWQTSVSDLLGDRNITDYRPEIETSIFGSLRSSLKIVKR